MPISSQDAWFVFDGYHSVDSAHTTEASAIARAEFLAELSPGYYGNIAHVFQGTKISYSEEG